MKTSFVIGSSGTGFNVFSLASSYGLLDSPAHITFTVVVGFVFMFFGGVTLVMLNRWVNKLVSKYK